jgi:hypothetical protein
MSKTTDRLERLVKAARKVDQLVNGREVPDPVPMTAGLDLKQPESIQHMLQRMVKQHVSALAQSEGYESIDEAMDFDTGEDMELKNPYDIDNFIPTSGQNTDSDNNVNSGDTSEDSTDVTEVTNNAE